MSVNKQSGFSIVEVVIVFLIIGLLSFIGWSVYNHYYSSKPAAKTSNSANSQTSNPPSNTSNNPTNQPPTNANLVTDYFAPANISFSHDKSWTWDTTGETYGYAGHPDEKSAQLTLPYQGKNDTVPSRYTIGFTSDSIPPTSEPDLTTFTKLGQVKLGSQTLYILHAYYDANVSTSLDKIITSSCPDKACDFQLNGTSLYFYAGAGKGIQNATPLDASMVPAMTTILGSMQLGKQ